MRGCRFSGIAVIILFASYGAGCGGGGGGSASAATSAAIVINSAPQDQKIVEGQAANFQVAATGTGTLSYQWQLNGADIAGATAASYSTPIQPASADNSRFQVRIFNATTSVIAGPALLRVYAETSVPIPATYSINPSTTDSAIDSIFGAYYAAVSSAVARKGKLFVFFPGTNATPLSYRLIVEAAANNGYHALGLAYSNAQTAFSLCTSSSDINCPGNVREEQLTGADVSAQIAVPRADSIENRMSKALAYLAQQYPQDGWNSYLDSSGNIVWSLIRVAGHSQGGGLAAYIGKRHMVDRAILFSAPDEQVQNQTAAWLLAAGVTNSDRYYGFAHLRDNIIGFTVIQQNWIALQLNTFGAVVDVDTTSSPFNASHMLSTNLDSPSLFPPVAYYHNTTVVDAATPPDSSMLPVYRRVWQYLCFQ